MRSGAQDLDGEFVPVGLCGGRCALASCSPTRRNVPDLVAGSSRASTAILVALSRSSSGYFLGAAMLLILPWDQSLHQTRGETPCRPSPIGPSAHGAGPRRPKRRADSAAKRPGQCAHLLSMARSA